jgi:DNA-directed RNA polymerase subunit RPC12/RpoP
MEKKKYKVSDFLKENADDKVEDNNGAEDSKEEVNFEKPTKEEKKELNLDMDLPEQKVTMKDRIPKEDMEEIDKGMKDAVNTLKTVSEVHNKAIESKEQEEKEKEEIKRKRDQKDKEPKKKNKVIDMESRVSNKKRAGDLSKLQKLKTISRKDRGVSFPLFESNYIIKMHGLNTFIKTRDAYNVLYEKEFGFFQSLEKIKTIFENSEFEFKDGEKVDFSTFLEITSPGDLPLINAVWALANTPNKGVDSVINCPHCGTQNKATENIREIFDNSLNNEMEDFEYDPTKTIDELQSKTVMGKKKEVTLEKDEIKYTVELSAPNLKKYMFIDEQVRILIINRLSEYLPQRLRRSTDTDEKLKYLWHNKRAEVNNIHETYTESLLFIDLLTIEDLRDTKDNVGTIQFSTIHDEVEEIQEAIDNLPDELMMEISDGADQELISDIEYQFQGEPFKCTECGKWIENDNKNVNDMLFFTINSSIQERLSNRNQN